MQDALSSAQFGHRFNHHRSLRSVQIIASSVAHMEDLEMKKGDDPIMSFAPFYLGLQQRALAPISADAIIIHLFRNDDPFSDISLEELYRRARHGGDPFFFKTY